MNKVILIGNLTKDPELTTTTSGVSVVRFSLAVTRRFSNSEGERETDFFNIVAWRGLADTCHKYLRKGSKAAVIGSLQTRNYDAQDGTKRYLTEVVAEEVEFVGSRPQSVDGETLEEKQEPKTETTKLQPIDDDQLPF